MASSLSTFNLHSLLTPPPPHRHYTTTLHGLGLTKRILPRPQTLFITLTPAAALQSPPSPDLHPTILPCQTYPPKSTSSYTHLSNDILSFWKTHEGIHQTSLEFTNSKGWADHKGLQDSLLVAQLRLLANVAADRAEMHAMLAEQRDNWNKLFQTTITITTMTAAVLAALHGQAATSLSTSAPAFLLNLGSAFMMSVINRFQPSQLAEEQRSASRLFKQLVGDINYTLLLSPDLREDAHSFLEGCTSRLHALDKAFPLPLTPGGLEKFPEVVAPPALIEDLDSTRPKVPVSNPECNGWSQQISSDLDNVSEVLQDKDITTYIGWAENVKRINKVLAIAAPVFALTGAILSAINAFGGKNLGVFAAVSSVMAALMGSFSHDAQLGMILELYRNTAGYYAQVVSSIQRVQRLPVERRENGVLFRQRVAYQLGRSACGGYPMVPKGSKTGGTLF